MRDDDSGLCRVAVYAGGATVDLTLPAGLPVIELLPALVDLADAEPHPGGYRLRRVAGPALDDSKTLAQQRIHDGALLVLSRHPIADPVVVGDDPAEVLCAQSRPWPRSARRWAGALAAGGWAAAGGLLTVSAAGTAVPDTAARGAAAAAAVGVAALGAAVATSRRDGRHGLGCGLVAAGYGAVAGYLAVPGGPGPGNVLLAAMACAAVAAAARALTGCGAVTFTAVTWLGVLVAAAALVGLLTGVAPRGLGAAGAVLAVGLSAVAGRLALTVAGLTGADPVAGARLRRAARRAADLVTALVVAAAAAGALGAVVVAAAAPGWGGAGFAAVFGVLLLVRARAHNDAARVAALSACGAVAVTAGFTAAARSTDDPVWICGASALLVAVALTAAAGWPATPGLRRAVDLLEYAAAAALVPLAVWLTGGYRVLTELVPAR